MNWIKKINLITDIKYSWGIRANYNGTDLYEKKKSKDAQLAITYNNQGVYAKNQGRFAEALDNYNKALDLKPNYAKAYINRANLYAAQGLISEALADYDQAITIGLKVKKDLAALYINRGLLFLTLKTISLQIGY